MLEFNNCQLPEWFRLQTGFTWCDPAGDVFTLLGFGGWRDTKYEGEITLFREGKVIAHAVQDIVFKPPGLIATMCYKGEFSILDLFHKNYNQEWWNACRPLEAANNKYLLDCRNEDGDLQKHDWHWCEPGGTRVPHQRHT